MRFSNDWLEPVEDLIRSYKTIAKLIAVIILVLLLVLCWNIGIKNELHGAKENTDLSTSSASYLGEDTKHAFPLLTITELDQVTDKADNAEAVNLSSFKNNYDISSGGDYILSGNLEGTININVEEETLHLFLDNVSIASQQGPAINIQSASKVIITLLPDTENVISDNGDYREFTEYPACIYSDCDLTINGSGALTVNGYYKDAIYSKDILKILDGTYTVKCKRNALHANDGMHIAGGEMYISTEKNGFKTEKKGSDGRGNLMISGGEFNIIAGEYAFVTTKASLYIYDCTINQKSIVDVYNIAKRKLVQEGCVNE